MFSDRIMFIASGGGGEGGSSDKKNPKNQNQKHKP